MIISSVGRALARKSCSAVARQSDQVRLVHPHRIWRQSSIVRMSSRTACERRCYTRVLEMVSTTIPGWCYHPRDRTLVIATHGRGVWALHVSGVQGRSGVQGGSLRDLFQRPPDAVVIRFEAGRHTVLDDERDRGCGSAAAELVGIPERNTSGCFESPLGVT